MGETTSQCAIRETLEETGVLTEITGLLGVYSDPGHIVAYSDGEGRQEYEVILTGRPVSGEPTVNDEASDVAWFAPDDLGTWTSIQRSGGNSATGSTAPARTSTSAVN
jgi:8-oxo-dGTP pyrophosphatase MutT (NUDIX family)